MSKSTAPETEYRHEDSGDEHRDPRPTRWYCACCGAPIASLADTQHRCLTCLDAQCQPLEGDRACPREEARCDARPTFLPGVLPGLRFGRRPSTAPARRALPERRPTAGAWLVVPHRKSLALAAREQEGEDAMTWTDPRLWLWFALLGVIITGVFDAQRHEWGNVACLGLIALCLGAAAWALRGWTP